MLKSILLDKLDALQTKLQSSMNISQFDCYRKISKKLSNPSINPLVYIY